MRLKEAKTLVQLGQALTSADAAGLARTLEVDFGYQWRPVGDNEANYGLINIGSDPGVALVERVTNAIDAVLEREAALAAKKKKGKGSTDGSIPATPREAAEQWLSVPGGRVANLPDIKARQALADQVIVSLIEGNHKRRPTVAVIDKGVGLTAGQIPRTILSLSAGNKIDKPYLAGAYGQGGSTVLAFSPNGALFVSRRQPNLLEPGEQDAVAITFARYQDLDPSKNKNGRYVYLVDAKGNVPAVPSEQWSSFLPGTTVVHFDLEVEQYAQRVTQLTNSFWWLFQTSLFDPILPFWVEDHRTSVTKQEGRADRRTIAGNFTRLSDDRKDKVEHADSVEVHLQHRTGSTSAKVNYWVLRQKEDGAGTQPIDAYVDPYRPIAYTFNGQTHGTDERRFTAERLQLPYLAKFLIVQVELDSLTPPARRELLSSTRDRLKQGQLFEALREAVCEALATDDDLLRLNDERKEQLLKRHSDKDREKMKQRFADLMERLKPGVDAQAMAKGKEEGGRKQSRSVSREPLAPLPTVQEPTFVRIANTQKPLRVELDRHALIRIESDAPDGYLTSHVHARLTLTCTPPGLIKVESNSDFRGGRARISVSPTEKAKSGDSGRLTVFLLTPKNESFTDEISFLVDAASPEDRGGSTGKTQAKVPEPIAVYKEQWGEFSWSEGSVAEVREDSEGGKIYVNVDNQHIARLLERGGYQEQGIARMRNNFLLYTAFFAWAQFLSTKGKDVGLEGEAFEKYLSNEQDRAAQTVVHAISSSSRLADEE
jgi:hypothetical protein